MCGEGPVRLVWQHTGFHCIDATSSMAKCFIVEILATPMFL